MNAVMSTGYSAAHWAIETAATAGALPSRSGLVEREGLEHGRVLLVYGRSVFGPRHLLPRLIDFGISNAPGFSS